jgi:GntR family transcriptional regulator, carbon starvation induced regulator
MPDAKHSTLFETVYCRLRADIIDGSLTPDSKLRIEELREKYDISASPLREALNRLAGEGFVNVVGQRGFRVAPISMEDLLDITRLRIQLECEALKESISKGDHMWESNVIAAFHRLSKAEDIRESNFPEWEKLNNDFHSSLISACTSHWLLRLCQLMYEQHKRYRLISILSRDKTRELHKEHEAIKDAVINKDIKLACEETRKHIEATASASKAALSSQEVIKNKKKAS